jgi:hypothetical protein
MVKSFNVNLQRALELWVQDIDRAIDLPVGSSERFQSIVVFCSKFVPSDISEDDMVHYAQTLHNDEV